MNRRANEKASQVLQEFGITKSEQIASLLTVVSIAEYYKIRVLPENKNNFFARLLFTDHGGIIRYNANIQYEPLIKFSIAHELGHFFLHSDKKSHFNDLEQSIIRPYNNKGIEEEADNFAAELLFPSMLFAKAIKSSGCNLPDFNLIRFLSEGFNMSITATAMKLVNSGIFSLALIACEENRIKWFKRDKMFPFFIKSIGTKLDPDSSAGKFFHRGEIDDSPQELPADTWVTNATDKDYLIEHSYFSVINNFALSIIWVKDDII